MSQHTVLFVDDEENILSSLHRLFRREGYKLLQASSGNEVLQLLETEQVDMVVSDQKMPGMTGVEVLKRVRDLQPETRRMLLTGYSDVDAVIASINEGQVHRFMMKPWDDAQLKLTVRELLQELDLTRENRRLNELIGKQNDQLQELNKNLEQKVEERTAEIQKKSNELERLYKKLNRSFVDSIRVFVGLIQLKDSYMGSHSKRITASAVGVAEKLGLDKAQARTIEIAALLHDVGKIGISDEVLKKPPPQRTKRDNEWLKKHPVMGEASVRVVESLQDVSNLIRSHHEHYDGKGYPDGIHGEQIPLGARIIAVADAYDLLRYKRKVLPEFEKDMARKIRDRMLWLRGSQLDPKITDVFLRFLDEKRSAAEELTEVEIGVDELREGHVLARDLYTSSGILLASKDEALRKSYIEKILNYHEFDPIVGGVFVYRTRRSEHDNRAM